MGNYAEMISAEENENIGCLVIHNTATESSIFPVKNGIADDATDVSTNPSLNSLNVADSIEHTKPLFGLEVVKPFEGTVVAAEACSKATAPEVEVYLEKKEDEPSSVATSVGEVQETEKRLNKYVSIRNSELDVVETELSNEFEVKLELNPSASTSKAAIENKAADEVADKDTETESIQKVDPEQPSTVTLVAESSAPTPAKMLSHADVSYIPWLGVQLNEYKTMPKVYEDDVLIRVEATTISTRDCLERIRRDNDENLSSDEWVPGHEIVGHVVRAGSEAKRFLNRRVAALLPAGGGCSRYVRCHVTDLIAVPESVTTMI